MKLLTTQQTGEALGFAAVTVRKMARQYGIGKKVGKQWLFTGEDVEKIGKKIGQPPGRPVTKRNDRLARIKAMRTEGMTMKAIGEALGISESYVSKLLKGADHVT